MRYRESCVGIKLPTVDASLFPIPLVHGGAGIQPGLMLEDSHAFRRDLDLVAKVRQKGIR